MHDSYHAELEALSYRFVHLIEEAFGIKIGTFDAFFPGSSSAKKGASLSYVQPQHRIKLVKYPASKDSDAYEEQGVGAHKDSSGWLTFLYQVGNEKGLEVLDSSGHWIVAPPVEGTFVVNFGNAFEAATEGAVKATVHRVVVCSSSASWKVVWLTDAIADTRTQAKAKILYTILSRAAFGFDCHGHFKVHPRRSAKTSSYLTKAQLSSLQFSRPAVGQPWGISITEMDQKP